MNEVGDRTNLEAMGLRERQQVGMRAIVPSSFMISQITGRRRQPCIRCQVASGLGVARADKDAAGCAITGKIWPG
jgi:hypothetical protein